MDPEPALRQLVKRLRTERGQTLQQAAAPLGVTYQWLSKFELGERALLRPEIEAFKRALAITYPETRDDLRRLSLAWEEGL